MIKKIIIVIITFLGGAFVVLVIMNIARLKYIASLRIDANVLHGEIVDIDSCWNYSVFAFSDGSVWGLGWNKDNNIIKSYWWNSLLLDIRKVDIPIRIGDIKDIAKIRIGGRHKIVLKKDGTVWTWGNNKYGQLGDKTTIDRNKPVRVFNLPDIVDIDAGFSYNMALAKDKTAWIWGEGYGNHPNYIGGDVKHISAGTLYAIVVKSDGTVWSMKKNSYGLEKIAYFEQINKAFAGSGNLLAISDDDTVWGYGDNADGDLGDGTTSDKQEPAKSNYSDCIDFKFGLFHSIALKNDGTVWAVGGNGGGQLGDDTFVDKTLPARTINLDEIVKITAGDTHCLALKKDGSLWMWGSYVVVKLPNGKDRTNSPIMIVPPTISR